MNRAACLLIPVLACLAAAPAHAAGARPPANVFGNVAHQAPPPAVKGVAHKTIATVISEASGLEIEFPVDTFTATDKLTKVDCPEAKGCTLVFRLWGVASADSGSGAWSLVAYVDDAPVLSTGAFLGTMNTGFNTATSYGTLAVTQGVHLVRTEIYSQVAGSLSAYHYEYEVTTP